MYYEIDMNFSFIFWIKSHKPVIFLVILLIVLTSSIVIIHAVFRDQDKIFNIYPREQSCASNELGLKDLQIGHWVSYNPSLSEDSIASILVSKK